MYCNIRNTDWYNISKTTLQDKLIPKTLNSNFKFIPSHKIYWLIKLHDVT